MLAPSTQHPRPGRSARTSAVRDRHLPRPCLRQQPVSLGELAYDLLRRVPLPRSHGPVEPSCPQRAARLSLNPDQSSGVRPLASRRGPLAKSAREIMEILEAFDLTCCAWSAAELVGCDHKTVARYVALRDVGTDPTAPPRRPREIDLFLAKVEARRARPAARSPSSSRRGGPGRGAATGPGCPSRACGCSSTGARALGLVSGARVCSAGGWPGRATAW
jgi:hypothetical protein